MKTAEEIAQWVIDNRYPKGECNKVTDFEMYHELVNNISKLCTSINNKKKMEKKIRIDYSDSMDVLNVIGAIGDALTNFGLTIEILDGGDGYEEFVLKEMTPDENISQ